jgi:hypothetical protein
MSGPILPACAPESPRRRTPCQFLLLPYGSWPPWPWGSDCLSVGAQISCI